MIIIFIFNIGESRNLVITAVLVQTCPILIKFNAQLAATKCQGVQEFVIANLANHKHVKSVV